MSALVTIAFTDLEINQLVRSLLDVLATDMSNTHVAPLADTALVTGTLKLLRAASGPSCTALHKLTLPPWAVKVILRSMATGAVAFPKATPAKATPRPRAAVDAAIVPPLRAKAVNQ